MWSQDGESRSQEQDLYRFFKMGKYSKFGCEWQSTKNKPIPNFGLHSLFFLKWLNNARIGSWKSYQLDHNDCQICFRTTLLIFSLIYKTKEVQSCLWQDENLEFLLNWDIQCRLLRLNVKNNRKSQALVVMSNLKNWFSLALCARVIPFGNHLKCLLSLSHTRGLPGTINWQKWTKLVSIIPHHRSLNRGWSAPLSWTAEAW